MSAYLHGAESFLRS